MTAVANLNLSPFTDDWLMSRTFTFRSEPAGQTICDTFLFQSNGFVVGHAHPNEAHWSLDGEVVRLLDKNGRMTCELRLTSAPGEKAVLSGPHFAPDKDYEKTGSTHFLEENESDFHTHIQSFDLFDTLVARRCNEPVNIFRNVETKSGVKGFAAKRHQVEITMFGRQNYGIAEIYQLMINEQFLTLPQAEVLRIMELEEEWDNLFPIKEMVARVRPDDIIISDMYLPEFYVKRILVEKCGLHNKLYLSNYGKHHRTIWPGLKEQYKIRNHYGDNIHADIQGAGEAGIAPFYVPISKYNKAEDIFRRGGLEPYARAIREVRLETFHPDPMIMNALKAQVTVNLPMMILGAFWVKQCADRFGADKILAAARDCNLFHELLSSPHFVRYGIPPVEYTQISRTVCYDDSITYEAFFRRKLGNRTLLVDMVGSGRSFIKLIDRFGLQDRVLPCLLVADETVSNLAHPLEALVTRDFYKYRIYVESMNAALDGSTVGAAWDDRGLRVLTQPNEYSDTMREIIIASRAVFERLLAALQTIPPVPRLPVPEVLGLAVHEIIEQLSDQQPKIEILANEQAKTLSRGSLSNAVNS